MSRSLLLFAIVLPSIAACSGSNAKLVDPSSKQENPNIAEIPLEQLGEELYKVLRVEPLDQASREKLASVVRAQLLEASSLFRRGYPAEGLRAVVGALLLIPENAAFSSKSALYPAATQGLGSELLQAAHVAARAGNEGWAVALYRLAANDKKLSQEQALELESHLQAIEHWQTAKRSAGNVELAGDRAIYAAELAILSPSAENVASAGEAILTWIAAAKTMMTQFRRLVMRQHRPFWRLGAER